MTLPTSSGAIEFVADESVPVGYFQIEQGTRKVRLSLQHFRQLAAEVSDEYGVTELDA